MVGVPPHGIQEFVQGDRFASAGKSLRNERIHLAPEARLQSHKQGQACGWSSSGVGAHLIDDFGRIRGGRFVINLFAARTCRDSDEGTKAPTRDGSSC